MRTYVVPAGTKVAKCSGTTCGAPIYWIRDAKSITPRPVPVDCSEAYGGIAPSEAKDASQSDLFSQTVVVNDGRGIHHMQVCPNADEFQNRNG